MSTFPNHVDAIIVGTSLTNSILAAACSRIGKTVLHLDENKYYGDYEASFTFQQFIDWIKLKYPDDPSTKSVPQDLIDKSRMFCLDLAPRFLFSNGEMVDLLVKSNVARYHEFKNNIRILCLAGETDIHVLPCRRNEVFTSPLLSNLADKRRLMKFIETCVKHHVTDDPSAESLREVSEIESNEGKPIDEYLQERGLKPILRDYIVNCIAMVSPTDTTGEACKRIRNFMIATERYGRSPFLFPLYGCGEFPQSFCRMSAVFGGVYCLNTKLLEAKRCLEKDDGLGTDSKCKYTVRFGDENHCVTSNMLVVDQQNAVRLGLKSLDSSKNRVIISRAILITNKSIVIQPETTDESANANDLISFLRIPPTNGKNKNNVYLIEVNSSALVCPQGLNIVYMWTQSGTLDELASPGEADLKLTIDRLYSEPDRAESILWRFLFHHESAAPRQVLTSGDNGLFVTSPVFDDIDYTEIIREASILFEQMCPGLEFLPRAPDPDEIIHCA